MIDSHCHLSYIDGVDDVVNESMRRIDAIVSSAAEPEYAEKELALSKKYGGFVFTALGLHPEPAVKMSPKEINDYINFIRSKKKEIVAVGEIGLDYKNITNREKRRESQVIFSMMIELANELKLPIVIHCRDAFKDCFRILEDAKVDVVFHCFSGTDEDVKLSVERGYYLSLSTLVVKSMRRKLQTKIIPLKNMLLETDSPWLDPFSSELKNRPWNISFTADAIAKEKGILVEEVNNATTKNAIKVFKLKNLKKVGVDWVLPK